MSPAKARQMFSGTRDHLDMRRDQVWRIAALPAISLAVPATARLDA